MSFRTEGCNTTGLFMWWVVGEWPFEIAGFVRLGIVQELVYFLGEKFGCRISRRK
jgi:hypothetical protein